MAQAMAFLLLRYPYIVYYPNLLYAFSVHLLNCYFPDFWYYHTLKKQSKTVSISKILHIIQMSMEIPVPQSFSELLTSGNFVIQ